MAKKERNVYKGCLIALFIFIGVVVLIGALFVGGVIYIFKHTEQIEVEWAESDIESFYNKAGIENDANTPSFTDLMQGNFEMSGIVEVDETFTNEEITAVLNDIANLDGMVKDIKFSTYDNNEFDASLVVGDSFEEIATYVPQIETYASFIGVLEDTPIYVKGTIEYDESEGVDINVLDVKMGYFQLPISIIEQPISMIEASINNLNNNIEGITIESLELSEDGVEYNGIMPEEIDKK